MVGGPWIGLLDGELRRSVVPRFPGFVAWRQRDLPSHFPDGSIVDIGGGRRCPMNGGQLVGNWLGDQWALVAASSLQGPARICMQGPGPLPSLAFAFQATAPYLPACPGSPPPNAIRPSTSNKTSSLEPLTPLDGSISPFHHLIQAPPSLIDHLISHPPHYQYSLQAPYRVTAACPVADLRSCQINNLTSETIRGCS